MSCPYCAHCQATGGDYEMASRIIVAVSEAYGVTLMAMRGQTKVSRVALARRVAMYLMRQMTGLTLTEVAATLGKGHSIAHRSVELMMELKRERPILASEIERIAERLAEAREQRERGA